MNTSRQSALLAGALASSKALRLFIVLVALAVAAGLLTLWSLPGMIAGAVSSQQIAMGSAAEPADSCPVPLAATGTNVTMPSLTGHQVGVAHTIWTVAHSLGLGDRAAVVGIATSMQESTLDANPATRRPNGDVDVGPFQQRALPGWYADGETVQENVTILNDPAVAARTFFLGHTVTAKARAAASRAGTSPAGPVGYHIPGLVDVDGWQRLPVTVAAQRVQRSAFPNHYAKWEHLATGLVQRFKTEETPAAAAAGPVLCTPPGAVDAADCPPSGLGAERGLTPDGLRVLRCAAQKWPQLTYGGVRPDALPDHPSGRAIDIMTPGDCSQVGQDIADWARANAASLGVNYVIWCQRIWSVQRDREGWRAMSDRGSATQNHRDHVHITVNGNSAGTGEARTAAEGAGAVSPLERYTLTARFGQAGRAWSSGYHTGLDMAASSGTPIRAAKAGVVVSAGGGGAYGTLTKIDHGAGVESWYAHQSSVSVRPGQRVAAGEVIGAVGCTGNCFGAHLHLEVRQGGSPRDPDAWLAASGVKLDGSRA